MTTTAVRPSGPANSQTDEKGSRWYVHPITGERFISVTTALSAIGGEGLLFWSAGLTASAALDELPRLISATLTRPCERSFKRCKHEWTVRCAECPCGRCMPCVGKWLRDRFIVDRNRRRDEGARVHDVIETWVLTGDLLTHDDDIAPYVVQFLAFVADFGLTPDSWEMSEGTVVNREHGYAGTLDQQIRFVANASQRAAELCGRFGFAPEVLLLGDTKTREKPDPAFYADMAEQLAAYRYAEMVLLPDGTEYPLPPVEGAFVLQLHLDGYELRPVVADERTFGAFLTALAHAKWQWEYATASVSPTAALASPQPTLPKPTKKAAPRKTTKPVQQVNLPELLEQSATLASLAPRANPHPDSPFGDDIPF